MSMISTSRARNKSSCSGPFGFAFIAHPEIARFRLKSYKTLQSKATESAHFTHKINVLGFVQGELRKRHLKKLGAALKAHFAMGDIV